MANIFSRLFRREKQLAQIAQKETISPDGLRVTEFPSEVQQMIRLYGLGSSYAHIYAKQPNVRTVVDTIAREAAELNLKLYDKKPAVSDDLPRERVELSDHDMMLVLDEPTPGMSTYRFWFSLFADLSIFDRAIWMKVRKGGQVKGLLRVPPANVFPERNPITGSVMFWRASDGTTIPPEDLVVFWGYDPAVNHGYVPPMETLRRLLADEAAAAMDREGRWAKGLRRDGVIEQDADAPKMTDEAAESYLLDLEDALAGGVNSGRPALLQPGHRWKDSTWSPREMEWLQARKLSRVEVAAAFHMPARMVDAEGDPDELTLRVFYKKSLRPYLRRVESEIKAQLLPEFDAIPSIRRDRYVEFNLDAKLRGSFEETIAIGSTAVGGPFITVNEYRARLNLPPKEGGDELFVPLNSTRGGGPQASPQSPTETPAQGLEPVGTTPGGGTQSAERMLADFDAAHAGRVKAAALAEFFTSNRSRWEARYATMLEKAFSRMRTIAEGGRELKRSRWDKELAEDILAVMLPITETVGFKAADSVEGTYEPERTLNYMRAKAEGAAAAINDQTAGALTQDEPDLDAIFGEGRVNQLAREFTTFSISWPQLEMARQNGELPSGGTE